MIIRAILFASTLAANGFCIVAQASEFDDLNAVGFSRLSVCNMWAQHCVDESTDTLGGSKIKAKDVLRIVIDTLFPGEARIAYFSGDAKTGRLQNEGHLQLKLGISYDGTQLMLRQQGDYAGFSLRGAPAGVDESKPFAQIQFEVRW